jgi:hypothetical protein
VRQLSCQFFYYLPVSERFYLTAISAARTISPCFMAGSPFFASCCILFQAFIPEIYSRLGIQQYESYLPALRCRHLAKPHVIFSMARRLLKFGKSSAF